jgi:hypothetical protein
MELEKKKALLYELPLVLFDILAQKHGMPSFLVTEFVKKSHPNIVCRYVVLKKTDPSATLTLVSIDARKEESPWTSIQVAYRNPTRVRNFIFKKPFAQIQAKVVWSAKEKISLHLENKMHLSFVPLDVDEKKNSNGYILDLLKEAHDLYHDESYEWVTQYVARVDGTILPTKIRHVKIQQ